MKRHPWLMVIVGSALVAALLGGMAVMAFWRSVANLDGARHDSMIFVMLGTIITAATLVVGFVALILLPIRRTRTVAARVAVGSLVFTIVSVGAFAAMGPVRVAAMKERVEHVQRFVTFSQPLVEAITRYTSNEGRPPARLEDLVPKYLATLPEPVANGFPGYEYEVVTERERWEGNPWVLYSRTPLGVLNWDMLLYFPRQNYPKEGYGGWLQPVDGWAYVHE